jgi:hypothetical protein
MRSVSTVGLADLGTLAHDSSEVFADEAEPSDIEAFARASLQDILIDYRAEQKGWPSPTDCDRLDAAFADLEAKGIIARQNFWCCGTCGLGAIDDEVKQAEASGINVRGFTFYHEQDTEAAVGGRGVFLYYGSVEDAEASALGIAREIEHSLRSHGLETLWDGSLSKRIGVTLDWKRRQP